jgi:thiol-disulfide isomerase/thioredoxin
MKREVRRQNTEDRSQKAEGRVAVCGGLLMLAMGLASAGVVDDVRADLNRGDFGGAAARIQNYRKSAGNTSEALEALSWMGRAEVARKHADAAEKWAQETYQLATAALKKRALDKDSEAPLPLALGAAIETEAQVMALRGQRADAVAYLRTQLQTFAGTSIRLRIQKNINLLSMEGKAAPALQGVALPKGKVALIFFWAHWCPDCKAESAVLKQLKAELGPKGFVLIAPTQKYGYVEGGVDAPAAAEMKYIEEVRRTFYSGVIDAPAVVSEENFRVYGASTTPTLVLVDRLGVVRLYHPGALPYAELKTRIAALL